jgi:tRNA pseudouridine32 synthase/23S rRNA pseudouridine746 synthase
VHMESIGFPIVGDPIYGHPAERLMLHAEALRFRHPVTGQPIHLECAAPF